ncbi:MAG: zinc ribbon domain-containing protein [Anaerolineales bacterium]|nr:zinc ribbon domain-containing protein [Anaerolineales bacterium]
MPIYTYHCQNCGHEFDVRQGFEDNPLKICPECRKRALQKVYKPAAVAFKGSGFYVTDQKKKTSAAKPSKANGTAATESKPASEPAAPKKEKAAGESKPAAAKAD